jgi:hypothetical protein
VSTTPASVATQPTQEPSAIPTFTPSEAIISPPTQTVLPSTGAFGPIAGGPTLTDLPSLTPSVTLAGAIVTSAPPTEVPTTPLANESQTPTPTYLPITTAGAGTEIHLGETLHSMFSKPGEISRFIFFSPAETVISIGMFSTEGKVIPAFEMYAPDGTRVASVAGTARLPQAVLSGFILPATGAYIIYPYSAGGLGSFDLTVGPSWTLREIGGGDLTPNIIHNGVIRRVGDRETWTVTLSANSLITIEATPNNSQVDPVIELVGPDGIRVATGHDFSASNHAKVENIRIPADGVYKVRITAYANHTIGAYNVVVRIVG